MIKTENDFRNASVDNLLNRVLILTEMLPDKVLRDFLSEFGKSACFSQFMLDEMDGLQLENNTRFFVSNSVNQENDIKKFRVLTYLLNSYYEQILFDFWSDCYLGSSFVHLYHQLSVMPLSVIKQLSTNVMTVLAEHHFLKPVTHYNEDPMNPLLNLEKSVTPYFLMDSGDEFVEIDNSAFFETNLSVLCSDKWVFKNLIVTSIPYLNKCFDQPYYSLNNVTTEYLSDTSKLVEV